jgi:hypothetical protein
MENVGKIYGHLEYFTAICYVLWPLRHSVAIWYIFPVMVYCVKKNLATLATDQRHDQFVFLFCFCFPLTQPDIAKSRSKLL